MEKIKVFILKNPVIIGLITFVSIITLILILTSLFHFKLTLPIELLLIIFSQVAPSIYFFVFKEPISKNYRIIYALTIAISYVAFNILTISLSSFGQQNLNWLLKITAFAFLIIFVCIYKISGLAGNGFVKYTSKSRNE
jgi:hypothetical protein